LKYVVVPVDPVELVPLRTAKRPQNRMIQKRYVGAKSLNGAVDNDLHLADSRQHLGENLAEGQTQEKAARDGGLRGLAAFRKVAEAHDH
jgi:hypothetical protein